MRFLFILFFVVAACLICVPETFAAMVKIESDFRNFHVGDVFSVDLIIDTEGTVLNATEVVLEFPAEFLEYQDFNDGASVVNLWIDGPKFRAENQIHLAGITPGGFVGNQKSLITLNFKVIKVGQGNLKIRTADFLLHDGLGTKAPVKIQNLHLAARAGESEIVVKIVDEEMPESFSPEIIFDPDLFNGQAVLIFSTEDKGSGLDHFEVKEGTFGRYVTAVSPYQIKHQTRYQKIFIKVVDKKGNERTEIIYPQTGQSLSIYVLVIISILIVCVLVSIIYRRGFRHWSQKQLSFFV